MGGQGRTPIAHEDYLFSNITLLCITSGPIGIIGVDTNVIISVATYDIVILKCCVYEYIRKR